MKKIKDFPLVIIFILILLIISIILFNNQNSSNRRYISALEGRNQADDIAKDWNENATLISIGVSDKENVTMDGKCTKWTYVYYNNLTNKSIDALWIIIGENGLISMGNYSISGPSSFRSIDYNIIDSTKAFEIAKENDKISSFLLEYDYIVIEDFSLDTKSIIPRDNHPMWYIHWYSPGDFDNPKNMEIKIDAVTNEIIYIN
jgi:hypothetical protein